VGSCRATDAAHLSGTGLFVNYDYLVTGEVSKIRENGATTGVGVLASFGYDDLGRRTRVGNRDKHKLLWLLL
jgi:hypothetical protein